MTTRTARSAASSAAWDDQDVYLHALKVAVLEHGIERAGHAAANSPSPAPSGNGHPSTTHAAALVRPAAKPASTGSSLRPADGWTSALASLGDVFKDSSSSRDKASRFPKDFVKALDRRMELIARGADPTHADPLFRQTIGAFYTTYAQPSFHKKLKDNRQIEEVILMFVTTASNVLKKRLVGDDWKPELNAQVARFTRVIKDTLKTCSSVPGELVHRLETYCSKLDSDAPLTQSSSQQQQQGHDRHLSASSTNPYPSYSPSLGSAAPASPATARQSFDYPPSAAPAIVSLDDMPLVRAIGSIFGKGDADLKRDVAALKRTCTEQAAFNDLKAIINAVAQLAVSPPAASSASQSSGSHQFPFRPEHFESEDAFSAWRKQENDELQELLLEMTMRNPELVKGGGGTSGASLGVEGLPTDKASRRSSHSSLVIVGSDGNTVEAEDRFGDSASSSFVFVPPDPRLYYRRLYTLALEHDYALMSTLPPDEDVSLTILSPLHEQLLRNCQTRWRIPNITRAATFAGLIAGLYKDQGVPEECVGEALDLVRREEDQWRYWRWPTADRHHLFRALSLLFDTLLTRFFEIFQGLLALPFASVLPLLHTIHSDELFASSIGSLLPATLSELETGMRKFVAMAFEERMAEADSRERRSDLDPWIEMLAWIREEVRGYDRAFPEKVCEQIDPPSLFLAVGAPLFVQHVHRSRLSLHAAALQQEGAATDEDLLELYHGVRELKDLHRAFVADEPLEIDFSAWFEPYVRRWLAGTDTQTSEWVSRAISKDRFEPEETATHSSSIVDLIDSCKAPVDFILSLKWPNEYENAKFLTGLSRTIAKSIEQYANQLEAMFVEEMFPRKANEPPTQDVARPSAWLTKAKMVVQGDKKIEPFVFQPASCIKLNNIQAARKLLDTIYTTLDADKVSRIVEINTPPPAPDATQAPPRYLFTVKIVLCENLSPPSGNTRKKLDPFLILSDPAGYRVAKTRTLYETNDPRWDETLDVSVKGDLWLRATVYNRNLVDHHDHVGCAYIHLDPRKFSDFLAQDVWFRLEDQQRQPLDGRLLLRISMEGEKDDIGFYFGRAFRSLKRAEGDMVRHMVDKMTPFVRHYVSHQNLRSLLKMGPYSLPDLDKVRGNLDKGVRNLNAYVRDALATSTGAGDTGRLLIPPVADPHAPTPVTLERLEQRKKGKGPLTDLEIEDAIGDLLDYFEVTFATLKESLTPDAWRLVSMRLWKDILTQIEGLLVPPLSERPTEMRPLSEKEVDVVYKWLGFLVNFFHGGGEGVPLEDLRNSKYLELIEARMYYEWSADDLMRASVESLQRQLTTRSNSLLGRSKSVYQQRNLGTIRAHKIEKQQKVTSSGEMILRILRMHPGTSDFLSTQIASMHRLHAELAKKQQLKSQRGSLQRSSGANGGLAGAGRGARGTGASAPLGAVDE